MSLKATIQLSYRSTILQTFIKRQLSSFWPSRGNLLIGPADRLQTTQYTCTVYPVMYTQTRHIITKIRKMLGMEKLKYSKKHLSAVGTTMYFQFNKSIDSIHIMKDLGLPDTFFSWFKVAELHVWLMMYRLGREGLEGRHVRNGVVQSLWRDVDIKISSVKEDVGRIKRKEDYDTLQEHFLGAVLSYDEGILSDDRVLASAVWRTMFEMKEVDPEKLERLIEYIRRQIKHLEDQESYKIISTGHLNFQPYKQSR